MYFSVHLKGGKVKVKHDNESVSFEKPNKKVNKKACNIVGYVQEAEP